VVVDEHAEEEHVVVPDFTVGTDMLVDFPVLDSSWKKRNAQPEFSEIVLSNKKKQTDRKKTPPNADTGAQRMMMTGAAVAAQGAAMLHTIGWKKWSNHERPRLKTHEYGVHRSDSPSRSRSRHLDVLDCDDDL
jgi:hypothetical protein